MRTVNTASTCCTSTPALAANVRLQPVKPCVRSPIPDINPASADHGTQLRDALRRYRQDVRMGGAITIGMSANVRAGAGQVLRVGQQSGANYRFE